MSGRLQQHNLGSVVYLANRSGVCIGRVCHWKECAPGIRLSCEALNCGLREYLYDDPQSLRLNKTLIANPPLVLWPKIVTHVKLPEDVQDELIRPLQSNRISTP